MSRFPSATASARTSPPKRSRSLTATVGRSSGRRSTSSICRGAPTYYLADRRDDAAERLRPAARVRRDLRRRARRSARARQPPRARHPARHAVRARSLRQLPAGAAARRAAVPAEGPRAEGRQLRRVPREHRRASTSASAAASRPAPTTRSRFRKRSTPTRACTASSATRSSSRARAA